MTNSSFFQQYFGNDEFYSKLTEGQFITIYIVLLIFSSLSLLCCLGVVVYLGNLCVCIPVLMDRNDGQTCRCLTDDMIIFKFIIRSLHLAAGLDSLAYIVAVSRVIQQNAKNCGFSAAFITYSDFAILLCASSLVFNSLLDQQQSVGCRKILFSVCTWILPLIPTLVPLMPYPKGRNNNHYDTAGAWCWIHEEAHNMTLGLWCTVMSIGGLVFFIGCYAYLCSSRREEARFNLAFPIIYALMGIPGFALRICDLTETCNIFCPWLATVVCTPSTGIVFTFWYIIFISRRTDV